MSDKPEESRKRRARMSSGASTAVVPEEASQDGNEMTAERPRRASRVLSSIKDGFRRSASSRDVALRPPVARGSDVQVPATGIPEQGEVTEQQGEEVHNRQDKKRRKIGEHAGPSESGSSTDVSVLNSQDLGTPSISIPVFHTYSFLQRRHNKKPPHNTTSTHQNHQRLHFSHHPSYHSPPPTRSSTTVSEAWKRSDPSSEMKSRVGCRAWRVCAR